MHNQGHIRSYYLIENKFRGEVDTIILNIISRYLFIIHVHGKIITIKL